MAWQIVVLSIALAQGSAAPGEKSAPAVPAAAAKTDAAAPAKTDAPAPADGAAVKAGEAAPAARNPAPAADGAPSGMNTFLMLGGLFLLLWVFMIRPQRQQEAKQRQMLNALKKNDKVQTSAGIIGTVVSADPSSDKVVVRVDDDKGVKLTFAKASIVRVIEPHTEKAAESSAS